MTAPQEPLVMTLEEGLSLAKKYMVAYLEESWWPNELREKWPEDLDADYRTLFERPVVARDDAAELRAALRRCSNLLQDFLDFGIAPVDRGPARHAVEAARAALAATEGSES